MRSVPIGSTSDRAHRARPEALTAAEVRALVDEVTDMVDLLQTAEPAVKAELYAELGVRIAYDPRTRRAAVKVQPAAPCSSERVRGGT